MRCESRGGFGLGIVEGQDPDGGKERIEERRQLAGALGLRSSPYLIFMRVTTEIAIWIRGRTLDGGQHTGLAFDEVTVQVSDTSCERISLGRCQVLPTGFECRHVRLSGEGEHRLWPLRLAATGKPFLHGTPDDGVAVLAGLLRGLRESLPGLVVQR